ncbi:MAG: hypothetical protein NT027_12880 [Proteobacteria bacterium]|nr:hypothetical protein [Pseudomonadota bacterium]
MKIQLHTFLLFICSVPTVAHSQSIFDSHPSKSLYLPVVPSNESLFSLNPAAIQTTGNRFAGYGLRKNLSAKYVDVQDTPITTTTTMKEESFGAAGQFDLGAGAAAGVSMERYFGKMNYEFSDSSRALTEAQNLQSLSAKMLIDLAPGLRLGLALRWLTERNEILGNRNSDESGDRVTYSANLIGNGGGVFYATSNWSLGAAYYPAARGKSDILYEQRIVTESGLALVDIVYEMSKHSLGVGLERSVHKRDERAVSVVSEDGDRDINLDGISVDKNAFPVSKIHAIFNFTVNPQLRIRGGLTRRDHEWVFDNSKVPGDNSSADKYSWNEFKIGVGYTAQFDLQAGMSMGSWSSTLTSSSGSRAVRDQYSGSVKSMFIQGGQKF